MKTFAIALFLSAIALADDKNMPSNPPPAEKVEKPAESPKPPKFKDVKKLKKEDVKKGKGKAAKAGNTVIVHYTGWLTDGTEFDSSIRRGQPIEVKLGEKQVIKGWDEGVPGMKKGGKRRLHIPPDMAYGPEGRPPQIPGNSTLHFEIELLDIKS